MPTDVFFSSFFQLIISYYYSFKKKLSNRKETRKESKYYTQVKGNALQNWNESNLWYFNLIIKREKANQ